MLRFMSASPTPIRAVLFSIVRRIYDLDHADSVIDCVLFMFMLMLMLRLMLVTLVSESSGSVLDRSPDP